MEYFIVREPRSRGDVATVWNWKRQDWCWDLDGEYTAADGFAYKMAGSAYNRAETLLRNEKLNAHYMNRMPYVDIRVVKRDELKEIRSRD